MKPGRALRLTDIILLNIVAVTSLRWIASAASTGPSSLSLWVLAALFFFVPEGLAVVELSSRYPGEGGLYRWTQRAFGDGHGFMCGWCYWVNNLLYFPAMLLYVSANVAFALLALKPDWQFIHQKSFVVAVTLGALWFVAFSSIVGMRLGKWIQNIGGIGNWIPALAVSILGLVAWALYGSANPLTPQTLFPRLGDVSQLTFFAQMCFALAGLELMSFLGGEVDNPRKTVARGVFISGVLIVSIYLVGTLGILVSVPQEKITLLNGLLLPLQEIGRRWNANWLPGVSAVFIAFAGVGGTMAWFAGAARVPYVVGVDRYLPSSFSRLHPTFQTPYIAILVQTAFATIFTLIATVGAETRVESIYKIMVDMCLILYFIPYGYLFLSLFKLRGSDIADADGKKGFRIPGGRLGKAVISVVGFATTLLAVATTAIPMGDAFDYGVLAKTFGGTLVMILAGLALYYRGRYTKRLALPLQG